MSEEADRLMLERCQQEIQRLQKQIRALLTVIDLLGRKDEPAQKDVKDPSDPLPLLDFIYSSRASNSD